MTNPPENAPWWVWLAGLVIFVGVPALCGIVVALINRPIRRGLSAVKDQVENDHQVGHPYPNLRIQLDAIQADGQATRRELEGLRTEHRETRHWIGNEAAERRHIGEALDEHIQEAAQRDEHIDAQLGDIKAAIHQQVETD